MFRPQTSLGLVLLGLLSLASWGCSGSRTEQEGDNTAGPEVQNTDEEADPYGGRTARAVGKVFRKMQQDDKMEARGLPPGMGRPKYPAKTPAAPWETGAPAYPYGRPAKTRPAYKTEVKSFYKTEAKTESL